MESNLFAKYTAAIQNFNGEAMSPSLLMAKDGPLSAYYVSSPGWL